MTIHIDMTLTQINIGTGLFVLKYVVIGFYGNLFQLLKVYVNDCLWSYNIIKIAASGCASHISQDPPPRPCSLVRDSTWKRRSKNYIVLEYCFT